jgi:DNA-binding FadR family transcriptional regulator
MNLIHRYKNNLLESIMENIRDFISILGQKALTSPGRVKEVIREHQRIVKALRQKDKNKAVQAINDHLDATEKSLIENLHRNRGDDAVARKAPSNKER